VASLRELADFDAAFDSAFSLIAFILNRHIVDHMLRSARTLTEGDYERLVIWAVLAHQNVAHLMPPGSLPSALLNEHGRVPDAESRMRPLRLRDVAAITGIPRETVRRKLEKLAEQRWVRREGEGWLVSAERVDPDLREFSRESVCRFMAVADEMKAALVNADRIVHRSARPTV
jgi:CRP-like cAMP-binding protein